VDRACGIYGEECTWPWWENPKERAHSEDQGMDGIRIDLWDMGWGGCGVDSAGSR